MSQSTTKSLVDSFGFIPVLPGPCSLFRYKDFAGIAENYFSFTTQPLRGDGSDIVLGNVQLAEDRFPPVLLTFREDDKAIGRVKKHCRGSDDEEKSNNTATDSSSADSGSDDRQEDAKSKGGGWIKKKKRFRDRPHTGFVRDAIFYFEAEKPLGQLVKQRRRWINGAYMAGFWVLKEGWIFKAKSQGFITKAGAWAVLFFEIMQGFLIRMIIPATIACGVMFMVTVIPSIYHEDADEINDILHDKYPGDALLGSGIGAAVVYLITFAVFMLAHTPKAVPTQTAGGDTVYRIDPKSAYRPWLFFISFMVNAIATAMFFYVAIGVYRFVGWHDSPMYFKVLTAMIGFPYVVAFLDGIVNSKRPSLRAFVNLLFLTPLFMVSSLWFYVWFPCYASARMSDLSWGNRAAHEEYHANSDIARHRAYLGRVISVSIIVANVVASVIILGVVEILFSEFLTIILFSLLGFNVLLLALNVLDMTCRFFFVRLPRWLCGEPPLPLDLSDADFVGEDDMGEEDSLPDDELSMDYTMDHYTIEMDYNLSPKANDSTQWPYANAFSSGGEDDESEGGSKRSRVSPISLFGRGRRHRTKDSLNSTAAVRSSKPKTKSAPRTKRDNRGELTNLNIAVPRNAKERSLEYQASNITEADGLFENVSHGSDSQSSNTSDVEVFEEVSQRTDTSEYSSGEATGSSVECALRSPSSSIGGKSSF